MWKINIKSIAIAAVLMLFFTDSKAQLQNAVFVANSDLIRLVDGTRIDWSHISDSSIVLDQASPDSNAILSLTLNTQPTSGLQFQMYFSDSNEGALEVRADTLFVADLQYTLVAGQTISILRCDSDRIYKLDNEVIYNNTISAAVALQGKIIFGNAGGESMTLTLDHLSGENCEITLPSAPELPLESYTDGNEIFLRWAPSSEEVWREGNMHGYVVERLQLKNSAGEYLTSAEIQNSKTTLATLLPYTTAEWANNFPIDHAMADAANVAKMMIQDEDQTVQYTTEPTLSQALEFENSGQARYVFGLLMADQSFEVAEGMALGYKDISALPDVQYVYRVRLNSEHQDHINIYNLEVTGTHDYIPLIQPTIDKVEGRNLIAEVMWNIASLDTVYTSYEIERRKVVSTKGQGKFDPWAPANAHPFIYASQEEEEYLKDVTYIDSLAENGTYQYRIYGRNPFGQLGPASNVVEVTCKPDRIIYVPTIDSISSTETDVTLHWSATKNNPLEAQMTALDIYRSNTIEGDYTLLQSNVAISAESYSDALSSGSAYYYAVQHDQHDHQYQSIPHMGQLLDATPPAIPTGLAGKFISSSTAEITWLHVTDEDLNGYRVFVSNHRDGLYLQVTGQLLAEPKFYYEVVETFEVDSIYFKVCSSDQHDNNSDKSEVFALPRPDVIPPSQPNLIKVEPAPGSVNIGWKFSESEDVTHHVLQRTEAHLQAWTDLLVIQKADEANFLTNLDPNAIVPVHYRDSNYVSRTSYQYQLLAVDEAGNTSSSPTLEVKPYQQMRNDEITGFEAILECLPKDGLADQPDYKRLDSILIIYEQTNTIDDDMLMSLAMPYDIITSAEYNDLITKSPATIYTFLASRKLSYFGAQIDAKVTVNWDHVENTEGLLQDFQLYRSVNGSALGLYKTLDITLNGGSYEDGDIKAGHRYQYRLMARFEGGGFTPLTEPTMIKVPDSL